MTHSNIKPEDMPSALPGFEEINRYWDTSHGYYSAKILPGQYYVSTNDELIATVLGSCISVCVTDKVAGIGGMNHFMLPIYSREQADSWGSTLISAETRYGNFAMEHMINDVIKHGGVKNRLELKVIGGGRVMDQMTDIGLRNISFVYDYIANERLQLVKEDVGDRYPRKVLFHVKTGKVKVRKLKKVNNSTLLQRDSEYLNKLNTQTVGGSVDLF
ncbi:chemotaxis protein CheD [Cycloclasticus sp. 46_83_sub15_T18]|nr:chemotaxis protein CheD [Cycloclasticus sp. 46_83_sub15_T18]